MTFGSLFTGIGGFDLGLERAGMSCLWQVERDARCNELLTRRWPHVQRYDDVRTVGADLARVDLICGGFPCQDVSVAGRREGLAGERSGLWFDFLRILGRARPRWCVIENVPGLLSSNEGRDFATIIEGLVELGYGVCWRVLDAQYFGLAQRRRRVFIVGCLGDGSAASVLLEPESVSGNSAPRRTAGQRPAPTLEARTRGGGGGWGTDFNAGGGLAVAAPVLASAGHHGHSSDRGDGYGLVAHAVTSRAMKGPDSDGTAGLVVAFDTTQITSGENRCNPEPGDPCHPLSANAHAPAIAGTIRPNIRNNSNGATEVTEIVARGAVRRLTPRECERLQGFPDDWTGGQSDSTRYKQLGNAVAVPCATWLGRRILEVAS